MSDQDAHSKPDGASESAADSGVADSFGRLSEANARVWTWRILTAIGLYFAARVFVRTDVSNTPEMDEAEQLIQCQHWSWGYGPQPPLYTWVQKLFFVAFGVNLFALALLKNLVLFLTCWITAVVGREFTHSRTGGLLAMIGLFFVPHFVWSSQNDLTHSILAVMFVASTVWCATRIIRTLGWSTYFMLGLLVAGGVLSKYNYVAFFLTLLVALISIRETRHVVFSRKMAASLAIALLLLAPHLNWMWHSPELALRKVQGLHAAATAPLLQSWLRGFTTLAVSLLAYFAPMALMCGLAHRRWPRLSDFWPRENADLPVRVARRVITLSVIFFALAALLLRARFKERWIHPNVFVLPLLLAAVQANWSRPALKRFAATAGAIAMIVFLMLPGRVLLAGLTGQPHRQNLPYAELLEGAFVGQRNPQIVIAAPNALGGAVKLRSPETTVVTSSEVPVTTNVTGNILIVWDNSEKHRESLRRVLKQFGIPEAVLTSAQYIEAPFKYIPSRTLQLGFVFVSKTPEGKSD